MAAMTSPEDYLFDCKMCGDCCRGYGGTYLTNTDITAIADYLGISESTLKNHYCDLSGNRLILKQGESGYCVLWDDKCTIHPVKPRMCRQWPFIDCLLVDIGNWGIMANSCPGMRTDIDRAELRRRIQGILNDRKQTS